MRPHFYRKTFYIYNQTIPNTVTLILDRFFGYNSILMGFSNYVMTKYFNDSIIFCPSLKTLIQIDLGTFKFSFQDLYKTFVQHWFLLKTKTEFKELSLVGIGYNVKLGSLPNLQMQNNTKFISWQNSISNVICLNKMDENKNKTYLEFDLGFSHKIVLVLPSFLDVQIIDNRIRFPCLDKSFLGDLMFFIRLFRPPEPYKGKGILYENEVITLKLGKRR